MSNVQLTIGGRSYTVACGDGEEDHVVALGQMVDGKLAASGAPAAQSESRTLLYATLLLADELHERRAAGIRQENLDETEARIANQAAALAERLENLATWLEREANDH